MTKPVIPPLTLRLASPPADDALRARLAHGARLRERMSAQIDADHEPGPVYRVQWLRETAKQVVLLLAHRTETFAATYPDDALSLADAMDAIATARAMLLTMAPEGFDEPGT